LPKGIKIRVVAVDVEQLVYKIANHVRDRIGVYIYVLKYLQSAATEALNTLDLVSDAGDRVHIYAFFDKPDAVTAAKNSCQLRRYKYSKGADAIDGAAQLELFLSDQPITVTWTQFVGYSAGRRALLEYLAAALKDAPANLVGDRVVLHFGDSAAVGESELSQQAIAVRDAEMGVMLDSSDSDLILAMLLAMPRIIKKNNPLPRIAIRSAFYTAPEGSKGKKVADDEESAPAPAVIDDDDFLGPPPPAAGGGGGGEEDPEEVRAAIDGFLGKSAVKGPTMPSSSRAWANFKKAAVGPRPATAIEAARAAVAGSTKNKVKLVGTREYLMVSDLWGAMKNSSPNMSETLAFIALLMGSDLVPGINGGASPIPWIGGKFAWDVWEEMSTSVGPLVRQVLPGSEAEPDSDAETEPASSGEETERDEPTPPPPDESGEETQEDETLKPAAPSATASTTAAVPKCIQETGVVEYAFEYRVNWRNFFAWLRAVYAKKYAARLEFKPARRHARDYMILPAWQELIGAGRLKILDPQWALQVGLLARYALNYYGLGKLSRDPLVKDEDGLSLCGWCSHLGQTVTVLDAEGYSPYSRWDGAFPPVSELHLSGADEAFGYSCSEVLVAPIPPWMLSKHRSRKRSAAIVRKALLDADEEDNDAGEDIEEHPKERDPKAKRRVPDGDDTEEQPKKCHRS
jgi:hypothetical protein